MSVFFYQNFKIFLVPNQFAQIHIRNEFVQILDQTGNLISQNLKIRLKTKKYGSTTLNKTREDSFQNQFKANTVPIPYWCTSIFAATKDTQNIW